MIFSHLSLFCVFVDTCSKSLSTPSLTKPHHLRIGASLMDTIDDLINEGHIEPQLAMKILGHFDRIVQEVLAEKVKARMSFKVCQFSRIIQDRKSPTPSFAFLAEPHR
jgi:Transcription initiation factor IIA, gamma subunit, helical domain